MMVCEKFFWLGQNYTHIYRFLCCMDHFDPVYGGQNVVCIKCGTLLGGTYTHIFDLYRSFSFLLML
jgi:hypothetical protein